MSTASTPTAAGCVATPTAAGVVVTYNIGATDDNYCLSKKNQLLFSAKMDDDLNILLGKEVSI